MPRTNWKTFGSTFVLLTVCSVNFPRLNARPRDGSPAPDFKFSLDGQQHTLAEYRGKVVVLDFWASWCRPCQRSLPEISRLKDQFNDDVVFLGVNNESDTDIRRITRNLGLTFSSILDADRSIASSFGIRVLPTTIVIDQYGRVASIVEGFRTDGAVARDIERTLHAA